MARSLWMHNLNSNWLVFFISFVSTFFAIKVLIPIATKFGLVDHPGGRKMHHTSTPPIGGIAILSGILLSSLFLPIQEQSIFIIYGALILIAITGIIDDYNELRALFRLAIQVAVTLIVILCGDIVIRQLGNILFFHTLGLNIFAIPLTVFAFVGIINAVNMVDGVDGLLASLACVQFSFLYGVALYTHRITIAGFILTIIAALLAFSCFNFRIPGRNTALIFMGDSGSMLIGLLLVYFCIVLTQGEKAVVPPVIMLWLVVYPVFDCCNVFVRRLRKGYSPFKPDHQHLHYQLLFAGWRPTHISILLALSTLLLASAAFFASYIGVPDGILFIIYLLSLVCYVRTLLHTWKVRKIVRRWGMKLNHG
jgi:UDP-GlcNAc:undecaprenyl-phosphate/decaprenyl-phosphate GlcNAc-1-phosphate transferase